MTKYRIPKHMNADFFYARYPRCESCVRFRLEFTMALLTASYPLVNRATTEMTRHSIRTEECIRRDLYNIEGT